MVASVRRVRRPAYPAAGPGFTDADVSGVPLAPDRLSSTFAALAGHSPGHATPRPIAHQAARNEEVAS